MTVKPYYAYLEAWIVSIRTDLSKIGRFNLVLRYSIIFAISLLVVSLFFIPADVEGLKVVPTSFDKSEYSVGDTPIITVTYPDANLNPNVIESLNVKVEVKVGSSFQGIIIGTVSIQETGSNTGIFSGPLIQISQEHTIHQASGLENKIIEARLSYSGASGFASAKLIQSSQTTSFGNTTYDKNGFSMNIPNNWLIEESPERDGNFVGYTVITNPPGEQNAEIRIGKLENQIPSVSDQQYLDQMSAYFEYECATSAEKSGGTCSILSRDFSNYFVEDGKTKFVNVYTIEITFGDGGSIEASLIHFEIPHGNDTWILTGMTLANNPNQQLDDIMQTFQISDNVDTTSSESEYSGGSVSCPSISGWKMYNEFQGTSNSYTCEYESTPDPIYGTNYASLWLEWYDSVPQYVEPSSGGWCSGDTSGGSHFSSTRYVLAGFDQYYSEFFSAGKTLLKHAESIKIGASCSSSGYDSSKDDIPEPTPTPIPEPTPTPIPEPTPTPIPEPTPEPFTFDIIPSTKTINIKPGETKTISVDVVKLSGTPEEVTIGGFVDHYPGVSLDITRSIYSYANHLTGIPDPKFPVSFTLTAKPDTKPGKAEIELRAFTLGEDENIVFEFITVNVGEPEPFTYDVILSTKTVNIKPGDSQTITINVIKRTGTPEKVTLFLYQDLPNDLFIFFPHGSSLEVTGGTPDPKFSKSFSITTKPSLTPNKYTFQLIHTTEATAGQHPEGDNRITISVNVESPIPNVDELIKDGKGMLRHENYNQAIKLFEEANDIAPSDEISSLIDKAKALKQRSLQPKIGVAAAVNGNFQVKLPDGTWMKLSSGKAIHFNDEIRSGSKARMQVMLNDETVFTLGPNTHLVMDTFVYDPSQPIPDIKQGTFRIVTGLTPIAPPTINKIKLPVGTIGIRATDFITNYDPLSKTAHVVLYEGKVDIITDNGNKVEPIGAGTIAVFDKTGITKLLPLSNQQWSFVNNECGFEYDELPELTIDNKQLSTKQDKKIITKTTDDLNGLESYNVGITTPTYWTSFDSIDTSQFPDRTYYFGWNSGWDKWIRLGIIHDIGQRINLENYNEVTKYFEDYEKQRCADTGENPVFVELGDEKGYQSCLEIGDFNFNQVTVDGRQAYSVSYEWKEKWKEPGFTEQNYWKNWSNLIPYEDDLILVSGMTTSPNVSAQKRTILSIIDSFTILNDGKPIFKEITSTNESTQEFTSLPLVDLDADEQELSFCTIPPVPDWLKNNVKSWADDKTDDDSFKEGISFMIKEKIITVFDLPKVSGVSEDKIPSWVKQNAKWWGDGAIDEDDFVKGLEYMIEKGIISIE